MTLKQFFNSLNGKHIDVDGQGSATNKNQCVDLIKAYCNRVFGVPISSMNGYGNAHEYYDDFYKKPVLYKNFSRIAYKKGLRIQAGDIVVWSSKSNKSGAGHIAVATGKYDSSEFESFDQNYPGGAVCQFVYHNYKNVLGVLRPKDQAAFGLTSDYDEYPVAVEWKNGSTKETVFETSLLKKKLGVLAKYEKARCFSKAGNSYLVVYSLNGTDAYKAGFVKYSGGVSKAPPESKPYKNGSTPETVYADTNKSKKVGSLNKYERCYCLGRINGMYLVLYSVNGSTAQKCGFVSYNGVD